MAGRVIATPADLVARARSAVPGAIDDRVHGAILWRVHGLGSSDAADAVAVAYMLADLLAIRGTRLGKILGQPGWSTIRAIERGRLLLRRIGRKAHGSAQTRPFESVRDAIGGDIAN